MRTYLKFCASIYYFYLKFKDSAPEAMTFWFTSSLLAANALSVYELISYFSVEQLPFSYISIFSIIGIFCLFNLLIVFRDGKYKDYKPSKMFGYKVVAYMVISAVFVIVIVMLKLHRDRYINHNSKEGNIEVLTNR